MFTSAKQLQGYNPERNGVTGLKIKDMKKFNIILVALLAVNCAIAKWTQQNPLRQGNLLSSVYFTDANTGYAVGGDWSGKSSTIYKTTDEGSYWTMQDLENLHTLKSVYLTDANTGYARGESGTILKNTNGGYPLGINEKTVTSNSLKIYPNRSSNNIIIATIESGQLSIPNLNGQEIITQPISEHESQIDISTLPGGIYKMKVIGEKGEQDRRFNKT